MDTSQKAGKNVKQEYQVLKTPDDVVRISLWLDDHENLFSDFDPRSFSLRELSDDFLREVMKFTSEAIAGKLILIFLIPLAKKNSAIEKIIKARLHSYFQKKFHHLTKEQDKVKQKGYHLTILGILLMMVATLISYYLSEQILFHLLRVMLEPAGWFMAWYGLDHIFYLSRENKKDFEFYRKMSEAEIKFDVY